MTPKEKLTAARLSLSLLGSYQATLAGEPLPESRTKKMEALLAYLALDAGQPHRRENLVGLLFPDMTDEGARTNLRQSLTRLRRAIGDQAADPPHLLITRESVQFNPASDHFLDLAEFRRLSSGCSNHPGSRQGLCPDCMAGAQRALDLYRGPFLDGFFLEDSVAFDDWVLSQRQRFQETALALASQLALYYERRGDYAGTEAAARRQIQIEPWREKAHRQLMRALAYQGKRGDALRQYERLAAMLSSELGLEPEQATEQLQREIATATSRCRNNLPARDETFVGRAGEIAAINEHLADPDRRLVSLVGPGGCGKTALAIETGWRVTSMYLGPFLHGVFFVPLAGIERPVPGADGAKSAYIVLLAAVADALAFAPTSDPARELVDYLCDRRLLLIMDNTEHLVDAARELTLALLRGAPGVQILVTSRTRLNLTGEWLVEVGGLPVHEAGTALEAAGDDAPALFLQRAKRLAPEISIGGRESPCPRSAVVRICHLVQGLPLGVELAASWVRLLSCDEIAAELEENLDFLRASTADIRARHRSLRAVFDYSWALLDDADRQILGRLSIFSGAFDREAAEAVTSVTVQGLAKLVDYSLLQRRAPGAGYAAGERPVQRFEFLDSLRHFAAEKQQSAGGSEALAERYSRYYMGYLAERLDDLRGRRQQAAVDEIAQAITNIRAAWRLAVRRQDIQALAVATDALAYFYYMRSWFAEGESSFAFAGDQLAGQQADPQRQILWARTKAWQGWFCTLSGQITEGLEALRESAALLRDQGAIDALTGVLPFLAVTASTAGDNAAAEALAKEARALGRQRENRDVEATATNVLSQIKYLQGDYVSAGRYGQESLALLRESGNTWSMAFSLANLGRAAFAATDYQRASAYYQEAIEIRERLGDARGKALGLLYLGDTAQAQGDVTQARRAYWEGLAIFRHIGSRSGSSEALTRLGQIARLEGQDGRARRYFVEALALAQSGQVVPWMLEAIWGLAQMIAGDAPDTALRVAGVVSQHPAASETSCQEAKDLLERSAAGGDRPEALSPALATEMLDDVAAEVLTSAQLA